MIFVYFRQDISIYSAVDSDSCLNWNESLWRNRFVAHRQRNTNIFFITLEVHRAERKRAIKKCFQNSGHV